MSDFKLHNEKKHVTCLFESADFDFCLFVDSSSDWVTLIFSFAFY